MVATGVGRDTLRLIADLKQAFGVTTNAQVIRRALALARVAANNSTDNTLTIVDPQGIRKKVLFHHEIGQLHDK
jgi:hypothetical protein